MPRRRAGKFVLWSQQAGSSGRSGGHGRFVALPTMRKTVSLVGILLLLIGISGTIDHLFHQPFFGFVLNSVNRWVVPNIDFLAGHELSANLAVATVGAVLAIAANRSR